MSRLSMVEIDEITTRTKAMTEDEKRLVLKVLPTNFILDEISRRTEKVNTKYIQLFEILSQVSEDMTLPEMQTVLKNCRETLKMD